MNPQDIDMATMAPYPARARSPGKRAAATFAAVAVLGFTAPVSAQESMEARINDLAPRLEAYIESGMKAFDNPGLAIGIVSGDKLVYAKGFGVRRKGGEPVDTKTVFQIGSTTKAFLATTMAIAVDGKEFAWDDRVVERGLCYGVADPVHAEWRNHLA